MNPFLRQSSKKIPSGVQFDTWPNGDNEALPSLVMARLCNLAYHTVC